MRKRIKSIKAVCAEKKGWIRCLDLQASTDYHVIHYHRLFIALPKYVWLYFRPAVLTPFSKEGPVWKGRPCLLGARPAWGEKIEPWIILVFNHNPTFPQYVYSILQLYRLDKDLLHPSDLLISRSQVPIRFSRKRHRETTTRESSDSSDADADMGQDLSVGAFEHEEVKIEPGVTLWV